MSDITVISAHELKMQGKSYRCAIGENGFTRVHKEGDKATPLGTFPLRECWFRADRLSAPDTGLKLRVTERDDGWCDDPKNPDYNRHIKMQFIASQEQLWREDHIYDLVVPIGFNDDPVAPGAGSAIFLHLARPDYRPTLGCVAVSLPDILEMLKHIDADSRIIIEPAG